jgi:hypothetical protein
MPGQQHTAADQQQQQLLLLLLAMLLLTKLSFHCCRPRALNSLNTEMVKHMSHGNAVVAVLVLQAPAAASTAPAAGVHAPQLRICCHSDDIGLHGLSPLPLLLLLLLQVTQMYQVYRAWSNPDSGVRAILLTGAGGKVRQLAGHKMWPACSLLCYCSAATNAEAEAPAHTHTTMQQMLRQSTQAPAYCRTPHCMLQQQMPLYSLGAVLASSPGQLAVVYIRPFQLHHVAAPASSPTLPTPPALPPVTPSST